MEELIYKMNPGKIELFEAAFGQEGIMGELAELIDSKVKANLRNRIRMDLQPLEFKEKEDDGFKLAGNKLFRTKTMVKSNVDRARKSVFVKET